MHLHHVFDTVDLPLIRQRRNHTFKLRYNADIAPQLLSVVCIWGLNGGGSYDFITDINSLINLYAENKSIHMNPICVCFWQKRSFIPSWGEHGIRICDTRSLR